MIKAFLQKCKPNPLERLLVKAQKKNSQKFLLFWNRGLGDIPLGLYAVVYRIRQLVPNCSITFLTRPNLRDGFTLLGGVNVLVAPDLKRGDQVDVHGLLRQLNISPEDFDVIIDQPDPTKWVNWQLGTLTPKLRWQEKWDDLWKTYPLDADEEYIGAHVHAETNYGLWRNWPITSWQELFRLLTAKFNKKILLFGFEKNLTFNMPGIIDLRGDTPLFALLSIIKNCCKTLIVPDSGISSMTYFLNQSFPIKLVSLWADPNMGILKQNVISPNPQLKHLPLIGKEKNIANVTPEQVIEALFS